MRDFVFSVGKYQDRKLPEELTEAIGRAEDQVAVMQSEAGTDPSVSRRRGKAIASAVILLVSAYFIYHGFHNQISVQWILGCVALLASLYGILTAKKDQYEKYKPTAKAVLKSLNAIESSSKPLVKLNAAQIQICVKGKTVEVPYTDIRAYCESPRLWVFLHGKSVVVLKKDQMVLRDDEALRTFLQQQLSCPYIRVS